MYKIVFYQSEKGECRVLEYIKGLNDNHGKDSKIKLKKINIYLDLLAQYGIELREPYVKKIRNEIWELRPLTDRFLFVFLEDNTILLLNHFVKKAIKTPKLEIKKAEALLCDYRNRLIRRNRDEGNNMERC